MSVHALTKPQEKDMKWLGYGWRSVPHVGGRVIVNGEDLCSSQTIAALFRKGFVEQDGDARWMATASGRYYGRISR